MQCDRLKIHKVGRLGRSAQAVQANQGSGRGEGAEASGSGQGVRPRGACPATGRAQRPDLVGWLRGDLIADEGLVYLRLRHVRNP